VQCEFALTGENCALQNVTVVLGYTYSQNDKAFINATVVLGFT
jgi:hypothetical protein